jgi:cobalamin-dependent methionine synthase I
MGRSKFEITGIQYQMNSTSIDEATENFMMSCNICCRFGQKLICDECGIASANDRVLSTFQFIDETHKKVKRVQIKRQP